MLKNCLEPALCGKVVCLPLAIVAVVGLAASAAAQEQAEWDTSTNGDWTASAKWDSTVSLYPGSGNYSWLAIIDLANGSSYTINLDQDITIDDFELTSEDATLSSTSSKTLTIEDSFLFSSGTIVDLDEVICNGELTIDVPPTEFAEIDDTPSCHVGSIATKTGSGDVKLSGSAVLMFGSGSTLTIDSDGDFIGDATATLENHGTIVKDSTGTVEFDTIAFDNQGVLIVEDGTLTVTNLVLPSTGVLGAGEYEVIATLDLDGLSLDENQADVLLDGSSASFADFLDIDTNSGSITVAGGASASFTHTGAFLNEDLIMVTGNGSTVYTAGSLTVDGGEACVTSGATLSINSGNSSIDLINGGELTGNGTVLASEINNGGGLGPGQSPGRLTIVGRETGSARYVQAASGSLIMEVYGREAGVSYDHLEVDGEVELGGTLVLDFAEFGGEPGLRRGDAFTILNALSLTGTFDEVAVRGLGNTLEVSVSYADNQVQVEVVGAQ